MKKQLHTCGSSCNLNKSRNQCKHGFLFNVQLDQQSKFNNYTSRWEYDHPRYEDHNVVLYYASLFFWWGAHLSIQCIIHSYWFNYLLKYSMKCEPYHIEFKPKKCKTFRPMKCFTSMTLTHILLCNWQTYFSCKGYIHMCTKIITKSRVVGFHPIDDYNNWPIDFEDMTLLNI